MNQKESIPVEYKKAMRPEENGHFVWNGGNEPDEQLGRLIDRQQKRSKLRKYLLWGLCFGFFLLATLHMGNIARGLDRVPGVLLRSLWYIPGILLIVLPFDPIAFYIQRKRGKEQKGCPDPIETAGRLFGVVCMLMTFGLIYDFVGAL